MSDNISKQEQVMISLLGRLAYPEEKLKEIITKNKRNPEAYIKGYNACDGKNIISEIAKIIGVSQPTITPILKDWEYIGIIFEVDSPKGGKTFMKLYSLPNPKEKRMKNSVQDMPDKTETQEITAQPAQEEGVQNEQ